MAKNSKIEWTDSTFNPWIGCTKVSPACDSCYAEVSTPARTKGVIWGAGQQRQRTAPSTWNQPLAWNKVAYFECMVCGRRGTEDDLSKYGPNDCHCFTFMRPTRRRVFCASLADVFDNEVDVAWRTDLFELVRSTPNLDWLLLTKRVGNVQKMVAESLSVAQNFGGRQPLVNWLGAWVDGAPPANLWLGATIANQEEAERDIPKLLATPTRVHFLSMEPLLSGVDLRTMHNTTSLGEGQPYLNPLIGAVGDGHGDACSVPGIDWVIVGGESGRAPRPMHPNWVRSLRDQCAEAGVPFLFKQWGEWAPAPPDHGRGWSPVDPRQHLFQDGPEDAHTLMLRVGVEQAGRLLDGRLWTQFPRGGLA